MHAKSPSRQEESQIMLREISAIEQQYGLLDSHLKTLSEKIGSTSEKLGEWHSAKNALVQWAAQEARLMARIFFNNYCCTLFSIFLKTTY